jgi:ribosomal protein S18 acetylase RimI-like enzyme
MMSPIQSKELRDVIIRPITVEDLTACVNIYIDVFTVAPYNGAWTPETARYMLHGLLQRDPAHCWCIEDKNSLLGFAFCTTYGRFRGTIQEFAIASASQKRGLGTQLMEHVIAEFRAGGVENIDLVANVDAYAFRFYKKFGFLQPRRYTLMARPL